MYLHELVEGIAEMLGPAWRYEIRNTAPVIVHQAVGWLIFDDSDENLLRVTLMAWNGHEPSRTMPHGLGIGETSTRIKREILDDYRARIDDDERRLAWHNKWVVKFEDWAEAQSLQVDFTADVRGGKILNLRADFYGDRGSKAWGAITVSYDGFPARVEYYTSEQALRERFNAVAQQARPALEQRPTSHRRGRRQKAA